MTFPTSNWGNLYDVYSAIPGPTSSIPGSSDGPTLGNFLLLADFSCAQFVQLTTGPSTPANYALQVGLTWQTDYLMTATTAKNQLVIGVNDLAGGFATNNNTATSGADVPYNYCAWVKIKGLAFALTAASVGQGAIVASSGTPGLLYAATAGTDLQGNIVNTVAVGSGSGAVSPVFLG
jgi:hypothetical protein